MRPSRALVLALSAASLALASTARPAVAGDLVISQIYGGGGNPGAPYSNDFISSIVPLSTRSTAM